MNPTALIRGLGAFLPPGKVWWENRFPVNRYKKSETGTASAVIMMESQETGAAALISRAIRDLQWPRLMRLIVWPRRRLLQPHNWSLMKETSGIPDDEKAGEPAVV